VTSNSSDAVRTIGRGRAEAIAAGLEPGADRAAVSIGIYIVEDS
jgi:hypothetical protein